MPTRKASATWEGGLQSGTGSFKGESGAIGSGYSFGTRFADAPGTNPEELIAAAHAACFSMALSGELEKAGTPGERVQTEAACTVEKVGNGFEITSIKLTTRARVPGIDDAKFQELANGAKAGCPVSKALSAVRIELDATLE
jgi:osmotically inducible protein OsmC